MNILLQKMAVLFLIGIRFALVVDYAEACTAWHMPDQTMHIHMVEHHTSCDHCPSTEQKHECGASCDHACHGYGWALFAFFVPDFSLPKQQPHSLLHLLNSSRSTSLLFRPPKV
jgi:hypothetical protein